MKKITILLIAFIFIIVAVVWLFQKNIFIQNSQKSFIRVNAHTIEVEIAEKQAAREIGLSGKGELCSECGMLFVFEKANVYPFWMKEMKFNLDIIWISGDRIVKIAENVPYRKGMGEVVDPKVLADKVLEINAGKSKEWELKEGDEIIFK